MFEAILFFVIITLVLRVNKKGRSPRRPQTRQQMNTFSSRQKTQASSPRPPFPTAPSEQKTPAQTEAPSFTQQKTSYHRSGNEGTRYEDWMPVPEGMRVCRCRYCGADSLIPKNADSRQYTCYFCREEL